MIYRYRRILIFILVLILVVFSLFVLRGFSFGKENQNSYYAFFLLNGQVYFGNLIEESKEQFEIKNVFYLRANDTNENGQFNLVKLGDEIHGPKNSLFIQRNSVMFYEILRDDSKLVESIKNK